jgi:hypothetical protein
MRKGPSPEIASGRNPEFLKENYYLSKADPGGVILSLDRPGVIFIE